MKVIPPHPQIGDAGPRTLARVNAERRPGGWPAAQATAARALTWIRGPHPGVQLITTVLHVIARLAPSHDPVPEVEEHLDLSYGSAPTERLDLYRPLNGQQALPVVVWAHGGAWVGGDKSDIGFYLRLLAVEGYACVAINYGLAPESNYPEPVRQTGRALAWLAEHATSYGLAPDRVVLAGSSAGAQIAAQYAAIASDHAYAADVGIEPTIDRSQLVGTVLHCGPYDPATALRHRGWRGWYARTVGWAYLGTKDFDAPQVQQASVVTHVTAAYPATLLTAGEKDSLSPQAHAFAARLAELGVPHEALWYRGVDHEFQLDLYRPEAQEVLSVTLRFLREHAGASTPSASG
jgi:acetyl esterase/lipase